MRLQRIFGVLALLAVGLAGLAHGAEQGRQYYELRVYATKDTNQQALVNGYWKDAAIPAYNRAGVKQIAVFTEAQDSPTNRIFVLIPFDSLEAFGGMAGKLEGDKEFASAAAGFMNRGKNEAPYSRLDVSLLHAMTGMPRLAAPPSKPGEDWVFELRQYISPTEAKGANKIDMFNAGEIEVMKEIGLNPVFFSGTVAGPQMPSLVYMTSGGPTMEKYKEIWKAFGPHPVWKKLSGDAKYKDNMTGIVSTFLKRTPASQI
jgi:hypothetical protein